VEKWRSGEVKRDGEVERCIYLLITVVADDVFVADVQVTQQVDCVSRV
jgi:hypothetical protein